MRTVLQAFLLAGTLDISVALTYYSLRTGNAPVRVLRYIASGVFGEAALSGGAGMAALGLLLHYLIALIWTLVFYKLYPLLPWSGKGRAVTGLAYGVVIWLVMNLVVVPLSNTPKAPFNPVQAVIGACILMFAVGLPISLIVGGRYKRA